MKIRDSKSGKFVMTEKASKLCRFCSNVFTPKPAHFERRIFCSRSCGGKSLTGLKNPFFGKRHSEESKEKISENNARIWLGQKRPGVMKKGPESHAWKGGINREIHSLNNPRYKEWRTRVFIRDGFRCRMANEDCEGKPIQAHHILRWAEYVELRYEVNNGITLCLAHHPRKRAEEKRLVPVFQGIVAVSN